ncbi:MAG: hypothetical protein QXZ28_03270 [Candidatus Methanomethylicaceae archaeon]
MKVRIPNDPFIKLLWLWLLKERPEVAQAFWAFCERNGIELEA